MDECLKAEEKLTMIELERDQNSTIDQIFFLFLRWVFNLANFKVLKYIVTLKRLNLQRYNRKD